MRMKVNILFPLKATQWAFLSLSLRNQTKPLQTLVRLSTHIRLHISRFISFLSPLLLDQKMEPEGRRKAPHALWNTATTQSLHYSPNCFHDIPGREGQSDTDNVQTYTHSDSFGPADSGEVGGCLCTGQIESSLKKGGGVSRVSRVRREMHWCNTVFKTHKQCYEW